MRYGDGTEIKIGDVVRENGLERYIVIGLEAGNSVTTLLIGTVQDERSSLFGETIILPQGYTRNVPAGALSRIGSARITIAE